MLDQCPETQTRIREKGCDSDNTYPKRPLLEGGASSEMYTGTWAEQMPTQKPLIKRPTMSIPMF